MKESYGFGFASFKCFQGDDEQDRVGWGLYKILTKLSGDNKPGEVVEFPESLFRELFLPPIRGELKSAGIPARRAKMGKKAELLVLPFCDYTWVIDSGNLHVVVERERVQQSTYWLRCTVLVD